MSRAQLVGVAVIMTAALTALSACAPTKTMLSSGPLLRGYEGGEVCGQHKDFRSASVVFPIEAKLKPTTTIDQVNAGTVANGTVEQVGIGVFDPKLAYLGHLGTTSTPKWSNFTSSKAQLTPPETLAIVAKLKVADETKDTVLHGFVIDYHYKGKRYRATSVIDYAIRDKC